MALEKQIAIDKIEILENGSIQVRQIIRIVEDGTELSASYHRWTLNPSDDLTSQDPKVVAIANAVWTPEVIAAYQAEQEANKLVTPITDSTTAAPAA
jgi:hypothetical protein